MRKILLSMMTFVVVVSCGEDKKEKEADNTLVKSAATDAKPIQSEFADAKYTAMGKAMMKQFTDGNLDAWGESLADNVVYQYSSGDSIAGKQAVVNYWKDRRAKVVQSTEMSNDIWLPIKVNQPQKGPDAPGVWLLNWAQVKATYRNGKVLQFWVHQDLHFNDQNKVDRVVMYMDRAPINSALGVK